MTGPFVVGVLVYLLLQSVLVATPNDQARRGMAYAAIIVIIFCLLCATGAVTWPGRAV